MKSLLGFLVLLGVSAVCLGDGKPVILYAQVIRGTDQKTPAHASWKPIGPKLSKQLCPIFRWNHYWEVNRQKVSVLPGMPARIKLTPQREIEIHLRDAGESEIRLFSAGKLVRKSRQQLESKMTIMGGGWEQAESWFIVVRRDKPTVD